MITSNSSKSNFDNSMFTTYKPQEDIHATTNDYEDDVDEGDGFDENDILEESLYTFQEPPTPNDDFFEHY